MTIGKLARAAEVGVETVRYYQRRRLLAVPQSAGGVRRYPTATIDRILFIVHQAVRGSWLQSRGDPRDGDKLNEKLWRTFLVYLTCSAKPAAEMLAPNEPRDFEQTFAAHFQGMTATPVTAAALLDVRERLLNRIAEFFDAKSRAFLESVEREAPDFNVIELPHAAELPGIRHKLANLSQRSAAKRASDYDRLTAVLANRRTS